MLKKFLKPLKYIFVFLFATAGFLFFILTFLNNKEFVIGKNTIRNIITYYDPSFVVESTDAKVNVRNYKIFIALENIKLNKETKEDIVFHNISLTIKPFLARSELSVEMHNTPLHHFVQLHENPKLSLFINNFFYHNQLICDGNIALEFTFFTPKRSEINLTSTKGWHDPKIKNLARLDLQQFSFLLHYKNDQITIEKFEVAYVNSFKASLQGVFSFAGDRLLLADFQTKLTMFPIDYLAGLWHPRIFSSVQDWVVKNIKAGVIKESTGVFKINGQDLQEGKIQKEAINVLMNIENIELKYLQNYKPITKISGNLKIDGEGLYLENAVGSIEETQLENIHLELPFKSCNLSLSTDAAGNVSSFKQFVPEEINMSLKAFGLDLSLIKGKANKANINLKIPLFEQFSINKLFLEVKAILENVAARADLIKFSKGDLIINNTRESIKFVLSSPNIIFIDFESIYDLENAGTNRALLGIKFNAKDSIKILDKLSIKGNIESKFELNNNDWNFNLNLDDAEVNISAISFLKTRTVPFKLECSGKDNDIELIVKNCNVLSKDASGYFEFVYSKPEKIYKKASFKNIKLGRNDFDADLDYNKNTYFYRLKARYLDINDFELGKFSSNKDSRDNYSFIIEIDKMFLSDKTKPYNVRAKIVEGKNVPIAIEARIFDQGKALTLTKIEKDSQTGFLLHATDAATFANDFGIYHNIKKGEMWLEMYPIKNNKQISYHGTFKLKNFAFTNTSVFTKIILGITSPLNSPQAFIKSLQGGSLQADSFNADVTYKDKNILIKNGNLLGPSYEVKMNGYLDLVDEKIDLRGVYIPSLYGINGFVSNLPLIGPLLSGGKDSALIGASFSITGDLKKPSMFFNPLSALTPGFIRKLFN